jgi:outer membrane protein TolC
VVDQYQQSLVPLYDQVVTLSQQRFNYMLIGAPDVLLAKQQALNAHQQYLQAVGDYWQAYVELQRIAGGKLPGDNTAITDFIQLDDADTSATPVMHH